MSFEKIYIDEENKFVKVNYICVDEFEFTISVAGNIDTLFAYCRDNLHTISDNDSGSYEIISINEKEAGKIIIEYHSKTIDPKGLSQGDNTNFLSWLPLDINSLLHTHSIRTWKSKELETLCQTKPAIDEPIYVIDTVTKFIKINEKRTDIVTHMVINIASESPMYYIAYPFIGTILNYAKDRLIENAEVIFKKLCEHMNAKA